MASKHSISTAIDFGISNTDVIARIDGVLKRWSRPYTGDPDADSVAAILEAGGARLDKLATLAVTGGRHRVLPDSLGATRILKISEVQAIGRGGQAILGSEGADRELPLMVASAGSGTALVKAQGDSYAHVSGTGVGGGTMLGLARVLIDTLDPVEVGELAACGDRNGVDLSLADVITGPIGSLPADATAVNFGRLGRRSFDGQVSRPDMAAALVNLVAQTIALVTINAAQAHGCEHIVITGHMPEMDYFRQIVDLVSSYYATPMDVPQYPGYATALGALMLSEEGN